MGIVQTGAVTCSGWCRGGCSDTYQGYFGMLDEACPRASCCAQICALLQPCCGLLSCSFVAHAERCPSPDSSSSAAPLCVPRCRTGHLAQGCPLRPSMGLCVPAAY